MGGQRALNDGTTLLQWLLACARQASGLRKTTDYRRAAARNGTSLSRQTR